MYCDWCEKEISIEDSYSIKGDTVCQECKENYEAHRCRECGRTDEKMLFKGICKFCRQSKIEGSAELDTDDIIAMQVIGYEHKCYDKVSPEYYKKFMEGPEGAAEALKKKIKELRRKGIGKYKIIR